jgi:putative aminopeptidase FrvX
MHQAEMLALLEELLRCHAPSGDEGEIDTVIRREFEATGAQVWADGVGNLYARLAGDGPKVLIAAHKDEIGMIVTDIEADGRLRVNRLGGSYPWKYGEGPVDILADDGTTIRAILSVGSTHTRSGVLSELGSSRALTWNLVSLVTGQTREALLARGVHIGSRAVVARERKTLQPIGDLIASYALDNRMGLVSLIAALRELAGKAPPLDLYLVATTMEEVGLVGALRAAEVIRPDVMIAVDTSPVVRGETPAQVDARPIIWYGESALHDKRECDTLLRLAGELGFGAQPVIYDAAGSDAGGVRRAGLAERTVAFGFPRDNSHGFEIAHPGSLANVTRLLIAYLEQLG